MEKLLTKKQVAEHCQCSAIQYGARSLGDNKAVAVIESLRIEQEQHLAKALEDILSKIIDYGMRRNWHPARLSGAISEAFRRHAAKLIEAARVPKSVAQCLEEAEQKIKIKQKELKAETKRLQDELVQVKSELKAARCTNLHHPHLRRSYPEIPEATVKITVEGVGLPAFSGIYFLWHEGIVVYVGQSISISTRVRLRLHHAIEPDDWVSWLPFDKSDLNFAESFYIGIAQPIRNFGWPRKAGKGRSLNE